MGARRFLFLESQRDSETNAGRTDSRIFGAPNFVGNAQARNIGELKKIDEFRDLRERPLGQMSSPMIARLWWPWLSWCMGNRWLIDATMVMMVALVASFAQVHQLSLSSFSTAHRVTIALSILLVWYAAGRPGAGLGALLAMAVGALTAWSLAPQTADGMTILCALAAVIQVPQLIELRSVRHRDQALRASARGLGVLLPGMALGAPALFLSGGMTLCLGGMVAVLAAMVLPLTWCRLLTEDAPLHPTPVLPRVPQVMIARRMQLAVLAFVALGTIDIVMHVRSPNALAYPLWWWLLPISMVALWHAVTGQIILAITVSLATSGWLGYAFLGRDPWRFDALLTALAMAQPLPLMLWHARRHHRRWPALLLVAVAIIPALAISNDAMAIGGAAMAACLAVAACTPRPLPAVTRVGLADADTALARARRGCQRLTPYWRHYGTAKLRYDPLYRQLAEQRLPWGRVLDAGCGPGLVAALASARGEPAYCGIDLDETKLEAAAELLENLSQPLTGDWRLIQAKLPLAHTSPARFDTVMLLDVLHYWPLEEQELLLRQLHTSLERGGQLFLRDGLADADGNTGAVGFSEQLTTFFGLNPSGSGLHFLTEDAMRALLQRCGFTVRSCEPSGGANRLWRVTTETPTAILDPFVRKGLRP